MDVVLAVVLSGLGAFAMVMNMGGEGQDVRIDSTSWLLVPVWLAATVPVLWWRRNLDVVIGVSVVAMAVHVLAFGWLVRCGPGLPLVFVLGFLAGVAHPWRKAWWSIAGVVALMVLVLVEDSAAGPELIPAALLIVAVMAGIGSVVRQRSALAVELEERNEELHALRDERAALSVSVRPRAAVATARHAARRAAHPARGGGGRGVRDRRPRVAARGAVADRGGRPPHPGGHARGGRPAAWG